MKPFSLETVLRHRKRLLDLARGRFADAQAAYHSVKLQREQCFAERTTLIHRLDELQRDGIAIDEHIRYTNRIDLLKTELNRLQHLLQKKHEIVLRERNHLQQKSKEHRVLEKLKEQQNAQWHRFLEKKEDRMLDEIGVLYKNR